MYYINVSVFKPYIGNNAQKQNHWNKPVNEHGNSHFKSYKNISNFNFQTYRIQKLSKTTIHRLAVYF